jgi:hypothetical protein
MVMQAALLKVRIFALKTEVVRASEVSPIMLTSVWCHPLQTQSTLQLQHMLSVFPIAIRIVMSRQCSGA